MGDPGTDPVAHVVHIGAGLGRDVAAYLDMRAQSVTLVEPDPELAARLEALAREHCGLRVIRAAVTTDTGPQVFRRASFPDLSSLRAPTGLMQLFPGLRILSEETVEPLDPVALIRRIDLPGQGRALLVIEAPGEALDILQALHAEALLHRFEALRIQEGRVPLYRGGAPIGQIAAWLGGIGYGARIDPGSEDPDRPHLTARLDRALLEHMARQEALAADLARAQAANAALTGERDEAAHKARALAEERDKALHRTRTLAAERDLAWQEAQALTGERDALRQEAGALTEARDKARQEAGALTEARDAALQEVRVLQDRVAELQEAGAALTGACDAAEQEARALAEERDKALQDIEAMRRELEQARQGGAERAAEIVALSNERDAARKEAGQAAALREQLETKAAAIRELTGARDAAQADAEAAQQDLSVALRMQALREADLKDLQMRYGDLLAQKEAQDDLLKRLSASLGNAASYLQDMDGARDAPLGAAPGEPPESLPETPASGRGTARKTPRKAPRKTSARKPRSPKPAAAPPETPPETPPESPVDDNG